MAKTKEEILKSVGDGVVDFSLAMHLCHLDGLSTSAVATAIEAEGVYGWDEFGRYRKFEPDDDGAKRALGVLKQYFESVKAAAFDPEAEALLEEDYYYHEMSPFQFWGWPVNKLPDFKTLEEQWDKKYLGEGVASVAKPEPPDPTNGHGKRAVVAALFLKAFDQERLEQTHANKNGHFTRTKSALESLGYSFDDKTLRAVIKELPLPPKQPN